MNQCPYILPQPNGSSLACKWERHGLEKPHTHATRVDQPQLKGQWVLPKDYQSEWTFDCSGLTIRAYCEGVLVAEMPKTSFVQLGRVRLGGSQPQNSVPTVFGVVA